ncbi:PIN domain-containing protein [Thermococcus sp. MV5]|uniref:PIN domain-containing protein n=1 Tax=Thermococcus sp. MV5 TaxID=1638272 RepID=UPI00143AB1C1|nr:PIN domain-containing protein [Thermococcus sp. MV5]NJE25904.1 PIN domain-containing protein [Thermococcus sp. MV5]
MHAVIDTNVLIYDTFEDSGFHKEARTLLNSLHKWYIPTIVLQEYMWFFKRNNLPLASAKAMISEYTSDPRFKGLEDSYKGVLYALSVLEKENLSISRFNDVLILYHAVTKKYPLATFDEKLRKLAGRYEVEVLPKS